MKTVASVLFAFLLCHENSDAFTSTVRIPLRSCGASRIPSVGCAADISRARGAVHTVVMGTRPVSEAIRTFHNSFGRPLLPMYRSILNEYLSLTHIDMQNIRFKYDSFFALGYKSTYDEFFKAYPYEEDKQNLYEAICEALELSSATISEDSAALLGWAEGKGMADLVAACEGGEGPASVLKDISSSDSFYYNRNFGLGVFKVLEAMGVTLDKVEVESIASALKVSQVKLQMDLDLYISSMDKMMQAQSMVMEMEAREKKRAAQYLADKAAKAAKEVEEAEKEEAAKEA